MDLMLKKLSFLRKELSGELYTDQISKYLYATDASAYRKIPMAVAIPKNEQDLQKLIAFANNEKITLIPRGAGTSLAGQVVGNGIIVDMSRNFNNILELNETNHSVRVQPGVVLDELNLYLKSHNLFFGPETSTSNRCVIGGMLGNNSCGSHSIIYGSTRDHTIAVKSLLSDGSIAEFKALNNSEFIEKYKSQTFEGQLYNNIQTILSNPLNQKHIQQDYPDREVKRRNTGYALDILLDTNPFNDNGIPFNFSKLIAGSEGTLTMATEIVLNLVPLPPKEKAVICIHLNSVMDALYANLIALEYAPGAVELMDSHILNCTKDNISQRRNRFFVQGDPGAILIVEFARESKSEILEIQNALESELRKNGLGYHFPIVFGSDINRVWALRKSGLGVLSNTPGDSKPVSVIEDTAIKPELLPAYIKEFNQILDKYKLNCVYHAHVGSGELHLRPVLNLKDPYHVELFRNIALDTAHLVKKYKGSLSGEHGDGRLRGEFIPIIIGEHNFNLVKEIKKTWDPNHIFNANKIVDTPSMNSSLRYVPGKPHRNIETYFDFSSSFGILGAIENCNGSADCRKSEVIGGTMCPSFMATRNENSSTRARANILREYLTNSTKNNPFNHKEIYEVLDLCLSCKGCKSECPSNVDMAKLKAEFLQQYYNSNGIPLRSLLIGHFTKVNKIGSLMPKAYNFVINKSIFSKALKNVIGFSNKRNVPEIASTTLRSWLKKNLSSYNILLPENAKKVCLFVDEFTNYNDVEIGILFVKLLNKLGYIIIIKDHKESGRTFLSKGLLKKARKIANYNILKLHSLVEESIPLIGIEPSCILTFRDEYPELASSTLRGFAKELAKNVFLLEEFINAEFLAGRIDSKKFVSETKKIKFHGHCQQKAIVSSEPTRAILSIPENFEVTEIKSGCCGMAGSFGYEKEHYDLSIKVGELVLFPEVRITPQDVLIVASGTSCRHHIFEGTGRKAVHPIEVLYNALV
jgi:FAD/FMN-containing dehydrogenase/Fe-S oxidoreductase